jgi:hypothetical protein
MISRDFRRIALNFGGRNRRGQKIVGRVASFTVFSGYQPSTAKLQHIRHIIDAPMRLE